MLQLVALGSRCPDKRSAIRQCVACCRMALRLSGLQTAYSRIASRHSPSTTRCAAIACSPAVSGTV
ncbi:hypothetical protein EB837_11240 [Kluyvera ascorbata]|uniref:Uncharacterized protein n=1 Tax=Kluyvera ascorbata TaxID=51288 RepID=A0A3N2S405_9ENTR|nr:hypothetical protein EB837_11240 [Kluyvera ascorbata]